ncbi:Syf1p [Sugiyamaella lignohabitans]|uniref:Pre-mRNA-splicing factor SYF1 n=1 Tax=Sugiyamaella lignohabitans TaxID=796027 RepID=A0A167EWH6_9ASCO|nr:Syf1p [Sugiyamaella lignohabitans]ANB14542.1 Syf1p [Sugiyamaella lignohabitans]
MSTELSLIQEDDILYEQEILKQPGELGPWLRYLEFTADAPISKRIFVFERACDLFKRSYKLWKMYLDIRVDYVARSHAWILSQQGLNEFSREQLKSEIEKVDRLYVKALVLLNKMPRLWQDYLEYLLRWKPHSITHIRHTFDNALRALPLSQHHRIWPLYINFANRHAHISSATAKNIWLRYILFFPDETENCIEQLIDLEYYEQASQLLTKLLNNPNYVSVKGKSRHQLWEELADILVVPHDNWKPDSFYVERVIKSGIKRYPDQKGKLCVQLATYWINNGNFEKARDVFEQGLEDVKTVRDFSQIFDSYCEFEESLIAKLMDEEEQGDLDRLMESFEQLMDRRPFMINSVLLEQNPNNVVEWEKRAGLWGSSMDQVVQTYEKAIETIVPKKASGKLYQLWTNYAKLYEKAGDLSTARIIFDKATKVPYKSVNELCDLWIEWAEMELRSENLDGAIKIMETATKGPKNSKVDYFDESLSPQERLHKSMKLWSFYVDLVESIGTLEEVKPIYDRIFELKIGTTLTIVNYANLLEENNYFEEAFKVYERGIEMFSYPISFEIWNIYLQKAIKRKLGIERLRDLFEQALEDCPSKLCKPLYLLYGKLEEERGLVSNAIKIYERATKAVDNKDKLETYRYYIARVAENFGLPGTRPIFQTAIDNLNDHDANIIGQEFIKIEEKLGEIDRVRVLYGFLSQFNDPRTNEEFWSKWDQFEVMHGSEDTYKEMLRIKRSVIAQFNTDANYLAAKVSDNNSMSRLDKQTASPIGFVASETLQPSKSEAIDTNDVENPDAIDIEIED